MQNDQIYSEITNLVSTRDDLNMINSKLNLLEEALYETKGNTFDFVLKNSLDVSLSKLISRLSMVESKEEVIKKIRQNLEKIKIIEITLAFSPSQIFSEKIANWLKKTIKENIAVDIKLEPSILGGVTISFEGKYFDGSLRNKLDNELKKYA